MLTRQKQAPFRRLVDLAWYQHAADMQIDPENRIAKDAWYRAAMQSATGVRSTRDIVSDAQYRAAMQAFSLLADTPVPPQISGWTPAQNRRFSDLAISAWARHRQRDRDKDSFDAWLSKILSEAHITSQSAPNKIESFDAAMAHLAIIAADRYWIDRTSAAAERRMRYVIIQLLARLDEIEKYPHTWVDYVRAIWKQSRQLPADINDAPAEILWSVLQMLDTHVRRLRKRNAHPMQDGRPLPF